MTLPEHTVLWPWDIICSCCWCGAHKLEGINWYNAQAVDTVRAPQRKHTLLSNHSLRIRPRARLGEDRCVSHQASSGRVGVLDAQVLRYAHTTSADDAELLCRASIFHAVNLHDYLDSFERCYRRLCDSASHRSTESVLQPSHSCIISAHGESRCALTAALRLSAALSLLRSVPPATSLLPATCRAGRQPPAPLAQHRVGAQEPACVGREADDRRPAGGAATCFATSKSNRLLAPTRPTPQCVSAIDS